MREKEKLCPACNLARHALSGRRWCCEAARLEARRAAWVAAVDAWRERPLPRRPADIAEIVRSSAPDGASDYRVSRPYSRSGGRLYFPAGSVLTIEPFQAPRVDKAGWYLVTWYPVRGDPMDGPEIAIHSVLCVPRVRGETRRNVQ